MTKAETKLKFAILIDISSTGICSKSDQELAHEAATTIPFVQVILKQMALSREIHIASTQFGRQITYPPKTRKALF